MKNNLLLIVATTLVDICYLALGTGLEAKNTKQLKAGLLTGNEPLMGYANVNGKTTGGKGGPVVTVSTLTELRKYALADSLPRIIQVSGNIIDTGICYVRSNKTIFGLPGSSLTGVALSVYTEHNVIVKNMTIKNVITYTNIMIKNGSHHVWVDHCDLSSDREHGWDYYDSLIDIGNQADYVTVSWNKIHDNNKAVLIGFADTGTGDMGHLHTTLHHNFFYNCTERNPCTRFGYMHVFNNYIVNAGDYGIGVTMGATVRTDNNYFENTKNPIYTEFKTKPGFVSGAATLDERDTTWLEHPTILSGVNNGLHVYNVIKALNT
ncbi:MAG: hypothetical protein EOP47_28460, partial [Sphingobacteriaceae bacterium]